MEESRQCERCRGYATHIIKLVRENIGSNATWTEYKLKLCHNCAKIACQDGTMVLQRVVRGL